MQRTPTKPCGYCESLTHYPYQCWKNPYLKKFGWKGSKNPRSPRVKKGRSKHATLWIRTRREWFINNPADHYDCYLCGKWMLPAETTLDHVKSRSRHPELRYDMDNLKPCCWDCNYQKGSRDLEELNVQD